MGRLLVLEPCIRLEKGSIIAGLTLILLAKSNPFIPGILMYVNQVYPCYYVYPMLPEL